jgi:hypothetical protein
MNRSDIPNLCWRIAIVLFVLWPLSVIPAHPALALEVKTIDLELYGRLLETHTRATPDIVGTRVDYRALETSDDWKRLVAQVREATPSRMTRDETLAFWINAYNILTIDLVRQHYPVASIKDIGSFFSPVWNVEVVEIEGRTLSLGEIEHDILRKLDEPRIHAAIVCASTSCPPLARTPFPPTQLDADLTAAMTVWLANREKGIAIDRATGTVRLSKVFDWFEEDFASRGGVLIVVARYIDPQDATWLRTQGADARIRYFDYDWSLNDFR